MQRVRFYDSTNRTKKYKTRQWALNAVELERQRRAEILPTGGQHEEEVYQGKGRADVGAAARP